MKHPDEVRRIYSKTDEEALQQSEVLQRSFQANKDKFVERFPDLADPFADEWAAATSQAREMAPDYEVVNQQANETQILANLMEQGRTLFQTLMLYVQLAYPSNKAVLRLFGQPRYDSSRNSQLKLPSLLRLAAKQASLDEYKTALMAKGMKEEDISRLSSLADEITGQDVVQEDSMKNRSLATARRITAMNAIWEKMALVCQCAKLVFQNDAVRYNLFLLTDNEPPKPGDTPNTPGNN